MFALRNLPIHLLIRDASTSVVAIGRQCMAEEPGTPAAETAETSAAVTVWTLFKN